MLMATPLKKTNTKPSTKTSSNKFKEFGQYIVKTVFPSEDEFKTSKANIEGIQQQLYIQILTLANGSIGSVKQLQQVKLRIYDLPIYPDENGTLKKLGREKISSADSNVSAKSDDRIQAPNTLQQVFSTLNLAVKKSTVNKTKEGKLKETFGADLTISLKDTPTYSNDSQDDDSSLKARIDHARENTKSEWFKAVNRSKEVFKAIRENDTYKDSFNEQDTQRLNGYLDNIEESLTKSVSSGSETSKEKGKRKQKQSQMLNALSV